MEGNLASFRWSWTGTHTGKIKALPGEPTGKKVTITGCTVTHSKDGKLVEDWSFSDNLGMLQQLGIIPPLG
jgi:predicted ester cyclase